MEIDEGFLKTTATSMFVMPLLGINRKELELHGLENAYIKDEILGFDYNHAIYILFKPPLLDKFNNFIEGERTRGAQIIDEYDYPEGWVMLVYQWPEKWKKDVDIVLTGKFSKVSEEFKCVTPEFVERTLGGFRTKKLSTQHQIYQKTDLLKNYWKEKYDLDLDKEDECWHFLSEREVFTQELLDKLNKK
jgi:hypothetical protein